SPESAQFAPFASGEFQLQGFWTPSAQRNRTTRSFERLFQALAENDGVVTDWNGRELRRDELWESVEFVPDWLVPTAPMDGASEFSTGDGGLKAPKQSTEAVDAVFGELKDNGDDFSDLGET